MGGIMKWITMTREHRKWDLFSKHFVYSTVCTLLFTPVFVTRNHKVVQLVRLYGMESHNRHFIFKTIDRPLKYWNRRCTRRNLLQLVNMCYLLYVTVMCSLLGIVYLLLHCSTSLLSPASWLCSCRCWKRTTRPRTEELSPWRTWRRQLQLRSQRWTHTWGWETAGQWGGWNPPGHDRTGWANHTWWSSSLAGQEECWDEKTVKQCLLIWSPTLPIKSQSEEENFENKTWRKEQLFHFFGVPRTTKSILIEYCQCTCRCSHGPHQHRWDTQHQAKGRRGKTGHLSLGVRWGREDSLVECLVGQPPQSLAKTHSQDFNDGNQHRIRWTNNLMPLSLPCSCLLVYVSQAALGGKNLSKRTVISSCPTHYVSEFSLLC